MCKTLPQVPREIKNDLFSLLDFFLSTSSLHTDYTQMALTSQSHFLIMPLLGPYFLSVSPCAYQEYSYHFIIIKVIYIVVFIKFNQGGLEMKKKISLPTTLRIPQPRNKQVSGGFFQKYTFPIKN